MIGHDPAKPGNWYEEQYVVLQLLRLLLGELRSVTWEVAHEAGEGIDCLLEDNEGSVAVQCKTKSTGSWTLRQLEKGGVLRHVADRLEGREDLRFRFVSDAPCRDLRKACEGARSAPDVGTWWKNLAEETKRTLQNSWALPEGAEGAAKAYRLARGIEVELLDTKGLDLHLNDLALALSPESKRLVQVLRRFARGSLTRRLREPEIRRQLEKDGVPLHPRPNDPAVHDRLEALTRGYLDKVWEREHPFSRDPLLDLLASVSRQWPDGVAKHLERWQAKEPTTLEWASHVFTAAPGEDSDALFEVRLEYLARNAGDDPYWDWTKLFQQAPRRAVRLLEVLLTRADVDVLTPNGPVWTSRLPAPDKLPPEAAETGRLIWDHLRAWWLAFDLRAGLLLVPTAGGVLEEGALPRLVELIAAGLAHELATNPAFLQSLLGEMPSPLRELDAWLLLRVGARLPEHATEAADAMARVVQQLLIGSPPPPWLQKLAVEFVSDTDQQTARTVLFAFLKPEIDPLFAEHAFIRQLIEAASDVGHDLAPIVEACDRQIRLLPAARVVLRMAEELAGAPEKRRWREADELTGLLARLVEESEREQDFGLRNRTLDAWDSLLEASVPLAHAALAVRLDET